MGTCTRNPCDFSHSAKLLAQAKAKPKAQPKRGAAQSPALPVVEKSDRPCFPFITRECKACKNCKDKHIPVKDLTPEQKTKYDKWLENKKANPPAAPAAGDVPPAPEGGGERRPGICFDWLRKACTKGADCRFSHDPNDIPQGVTRPKAKAKGKAKGRGKAAGPCVLVNANLASSVIIHDLDNDEDLEDDE